MNGLRLKQRLSQPHICCLPGIFDFISLKVADALGFDALYMTGYGTVASHLGLPDAGLATYSDMVGRVQGFCASTSTPIVCDGDTGYGGLLNVDHTVRGYEKAGAAAIAAGGASLYFGMLGAAMAGVLAALLALKKHTERVGSARPEGETTKD